MLRGTYRQTLFQCAFLPLLGNSCCFERAFAYNLWHKGVHLFITFFRTLKERLKWYQKFLSTVMGSINMTFILLHSSCLIWRRQIEILKNIQQLLMNYNLYINEMQFIFRCFDWYTGRRSWSERYRNGDASCSKWVI